jgi:diguanylate cyclase (GGDEF)-like protein
LPLMSNTSPSASMTVAFQAIADLHSGQCAGYEILARPENGDIGRLLTDCTDLDGLVALETEIRRQAGLKAGALPELSSRLLFANLDGRLTESSKPVIEAGQRFLVPYARQLVTEIASYPMEIADAQDWVNHLRNQLGLVALDRFGETARAMSFLMHCDIDFLKIPRTYIDGIDRVARQRVILSQVVNTAHTLGIQVIAVGIETPAELQICRELGCDMAQGFFIQPPVADPALAGIYFERVEIQARDERRHRLVDNKWIEEQLDLTPPLLFDTPMKEVFALVARDSSRALLPVVDHHGHPLGLVREQALRNHVYSAFGKELIANRSLGFSLKSFLERCPIAALSTPLDRLLGLYSTDDQADGIIITHQNRYLGFLSARSIIRALHEKTLARARDENPLTKLPGNDLINEYVASLLKNGLSAIIVYLDFDNFKPFNDSYGFRQGDRAILLFAELLRKLTRPADCFIGHIGGDDFFAGITDTNLADAEALVAKLIEKFRFDAESFYDTETREKGFMIATDRDGVERRFPLLSVSAVLLVVDDHSIGCTPDDLSRALAYHKKLAKTTGKRLVVARLAEEKSSSLTLS